MLIAQRPALSEETVSGYRSRFIIEPLEPGFGYTPGNSMHCTLLSSIPDAAVTSIKIERDQREFSALEGVVEDVTEIILNLKSLVLSSEEDESMVMYLREAGVGEVTTADIQLPAGVEVYNPELHITTLSEGGRLEMELVVEHGRGYVSSVLNEDPDAKVRHIPVDSIYSPMLKMNYKVEATRMAQRTNFDRLIIDVETKPSMVPHGAVTSTGQTLVELFNLARELNVNAEGVEMGPSPVDERITESLSPPVEDPSLSVCSYDHFRREDIHTAGELIARSEEGLLDVRNFSSKSILEVKVTLHNLDLALHDATPGFDPIQAIKRYNQEHESEKDIDAETDGDYTETEQY